MNQTTITDINIPFGRLVAIIFKFIIASIPAILFVYFVLGLITLVVVAVFGGLIAGSGVLDSLSEPDTTNNIKELLENQ